MSLSQYSKASCSYLLLTRTWKDWLKVFFFPPEELYHLLVSEDSKFIGFYNFIKNVFTEVGTRI